MANSRLLIVPFILAPVFSACSNSSNSTDQVRDINPNTSPPFVEPEPPLTEEPVLEAPSAEEPVLEVPSTEQPMPVGTSIITELNYVTMASLVYDYVFIEGTLMRDVPGSNMLWLNSNEADSRVTDCKLPTSGELAGYYTLEVFGPNIEQSGLNQGDTVVRTETGCIGGSFDFQSYLADGTTKTEVIQRIDFGPGSDDAIISLTHTDNKTQYDAKIPEDNGQRSNSLHYLMAEDYANKIKYSAVNAYDLKQSGLPSFENEPLFYPSLVEAQKPEASQPHIIDPPVKYQTFAFEHISDTSGPFRQLRLRWNIEREDTSESFPSFVTYSTSQLVIDEVDVGELTGGDSDLDRAAVSGEFVIQFKSGDKITVSVANATPEEAALGNTTTILFDKGGDGVIDHKTQMNWWFFEGHVF